MANMLARSGSGKKGESGPSPQVAVQKLRDTEEMLNKKSEFLEKKIEKETALARKHGMKNKKGISRYIYVPQEYTKILLYFVRP